MKMFKFPLIFTDLIFLAFLVTLQGGDSFKCDNLEMKIFNETSASQTFSISNNSLSIFSLHVEMIVLSPSNPDQIIIVNNKSVDLKKYTLIEGAYEKVECDIKTPNNLSAYHIEYNTSDQNLLGKKAEITLPTNVIVSKNITYDIKYCHEHCQTCSAPNDDSRCLKCGENLFKSGENNKCVNKCSYSTFQDEKTRSCVNCSGGANVCTLCTELNKCDGCTYPTYSLNNMSECVEKCPKPLVKIVEYSTKHNRNFSKCTECSSNLFFLNGSCTKNCSIGHYLEDEKKKICGKCPDNCKYCENSTICKECSEDYYISDSKTCSLCSGEGLYKGKKIKKKKPFLYKIIKNFLITKLKIFRKMIKDVVNVQKSTQTVRPAFL